MLTLPPLMLRERTCRRAGHRNATLVRGSAESNRRIVTEYRVIEQLALLVHTYDSSMRRFLCDALAQICKIRTFRTAFVRVLLPIVAGFQLAPCAPRSVGVGVWVCRQVRGAGSDFAFVSRRCTHTRGRYSMLACLLACLVLPTHTHAQRATRDNSAPWKAYSRSSSISPTQTSQYSALLHAHSPF